MNKYPMLLKFSFHVLPLENYTLGHISRSKLRKILTDIDKFTLNNTVLACNAETAKLYGRIKRHLKEKGQLIPENDIWIVASAQQYELTLVTRDTHFDVIKDLKVKAW